MAWADTYLKMRKIFPTETYFQMSKAEVWPTVIRGVSASSEVAGNFTMSEVTLEID